MNRMNRERTGGAERRRAAHKTENRRAIRDEREAVLLALLSLERNQTFSNVLVKRTLDSCAKMSSSERAFIKRLLEGVIERRMELDARIEELTKRSVNRLHPAVRQLLRMGIFQICYMDAVPDSAACNESVRLAKKHAPARLSGFVNGVLRNAVREEEKIRAGKAAGGTVDNPESFAEGDSAPKSEGVYQDPSISGEFRSSSEGNSAPKSEGVYQDRSLSGEFRSSSEENSAPKSEGAFPDRSLSGEFRSSLEENSAPESEGAFHDPSVSVEPRPLPEKESTGSEKLLSSDGKTAPASNGSVWVKTASRRFSSPEWLVEMWEQELGREEAERLLAALMDIFPVSARIRYPGSESGKEKVIFKLRAAGVQVENGRWLADSLRLRKTSNLRRLPGFSNGLWTVQDESSMIAVEAAGLKGRETVYDVCAAPGGKSFLAADILRAKCGVLYESADPAAVSPDEAACLNEASGKPASGKSGFKDVGSGKSALGKSVFEDEASKKTASEKTVSGSTDPLQPGRVFSFDLSRNKTDKIREGAKRLRIPNIVVGERDARVFFPEDEGKADVVFCDLPCSGLGVIGKKRDIKYRASLEGIASLQRLQREILANSVRYLKSGGVLIYSTCTISRRENEENAEWIETELGLVPDDLGPVLPAAIPGIRGNMLQLLPHVHGTDGFFVARFRKK